MGIAARPRLGVFTSALVSSRRLTARQSLSVPLRKKIKRRVAGFLAARFLDCQLG